MGKNGKSNQKFRIITFIIHKPNMKHQLDGKRVNKEKKKKVKTDKIYSLMHISPIPKEKN